MSNLISIVFPVYNGENYLAEAIESCLKQTYSNFELIIVNDCSTDNTLKIAEKYKLEDQRISIISNEVNKKLPASLNIGHKYAKGDFITWSSHDNLLKPGFLETLILPLKKGWDMSYSNYDIIWEDGGLKRVHIVDPASFLLFGNTIGAAFMYKKEVHDFLNGFNEKYHTIEDYDFWLRACIQFSICYINENTYQYRLHKKSLTSAIRENQNTKENFGKLKRQIFKKIGKQLNFHAATVSFLGDFRGIDFNDYKTNYDHIRVDLNSFYSKIKSNNPAKTVEKLDLIIRDYLKQNDKSKTFKNLKWLIKNQPGVLFNKNTSKKQTLKLLKEFVIKIVK